MKTVSLCGGATCCPVVKLGEDDVQIGEKGNLCRLSKTEWNMLVEKVRAGELTGI
jgi:hypothetical protein